LVIAALAMAPITQGQENPASLESALPDSSSLLLHLPGLDTLHIPAVPADTISKAGPLAGPLGNVPKGVLPDMVNPLQGRRHLHTTGQIEAGGINGIIPYSVEGDGPWNAYAKGNVSVDLLGIPVGVIFDLGTDLPIRGQRNTVRLSFDPKKAVDADRWAKAHELHDLSVRLDSIDLQRATKYRELLGQEARISSIRANMPQVTVPDPPALDVPLTMPDAPHIDSLGALLPAAPSINVNDQARLDSLETALSRSREQLAALEGEVDEARMRVQRLTAIVNAGKSKENILAGFTQGIKRLDIGTCTPTSSEFLINGISFQGVSFEYAHKDLFLAFDHGRSFDDTWQDADPVSNDLKKLQQSLFFTDAADLNPRKLTALKAGFGTSQGTHFHFGYLTGSREDVPVGVTVPDGTGATLHNQVVELDLGYALMKNSLLHLVYARSVVRSSSDVGNEGQAVNAADGLFNFGGNNDQAIKLGLSSTISRTGTHAEVEVRSISPFFQSFGMGYIRNGSKAIEGRLDQPVGKRLRLRGRYTMEERTSPGEPQDQVMALDRAQGQLSYRASKALTLRAGYIPVHTRTVIFDSMTVENRNRNYTVGGDVRKRWRSVVLVISADEGVYSWLSGIGVRQLVENHSVGISLIKGEQWSTQLTWTGLGGGDSLIIATNNVGIQGEYHVNSSIVLSAALQLPTDERVGWMCALQDHISKHFALGLRGESYSRSDLYFPQEEPLTTSNTYNWTASVTYIW